MKKLIASLAAAVALAASAAPEKVAVVRLTDSTGMITAVGKVCSMVGNPMLTGYATQAIVDWELYRFFGTPRAGLPFTVPVFADLEKLETESPEFAILFPVESKEAFLSRFGDVQEKDGLPYVERSENSILKKVYFVFSDDGKWVSACDKPQFAQKALGCIADAKPLEGDLVRASVCGKFLNKTVELVAKDMAKKDGSSPLSAQCTKLLSGIDGMTIELGVADDGIVMRGTFKTSEGSEFAKVGRKSLGADAFALADKDAVACGIYAEDSFGAFKRATIKAFLDFAASKGIKTDFLNAVMGSESFSCCIDIPALAKYVEGEGAEAFAKLEPEQVVADWNKASQGIDCKADGPAFTASAAIKGFKPKASVAQRFAKTVPEAAGKPLCLAEVSSFYTILKATAAQLVDLREELAGFKPMLLSLPEEGIGAMASAYWREGADLRYVGRISSDEIKSIGATANIAIGAVMAQMMGAMSECDGEDDEEDDDDED